MSNDRATTNAVLVLCRAKDRYEPWVRIFLKAGAESVYVKKGGGEALEIMSSSNLDGDLKTWSDIPDEVLAVLVHAGDRDLWNGEKETQQVFWFNAPGEPPTEGDDLPVKRRTSSADFDVTVSDAEEILGYSAGEQDQIPSCCEPKQEAEVLSALSILCQGYLAIHAKEHGEESEVKKALDQMGWSADLMTNNSNGQVDTVSDVDWWAEVFDTDMLIGEAKEEWGNEEGWSKVRNLLARFAKDSDEPEEPDEQETEPLSGEKARETVAKAYCKLAKRMGGKPCQ